MRYDSYIEVTVNVGTKKQVRLTSVADPPAKTGTEMKQQIRSQSFNDATLAVEWLNDAKVQRSAAYRHVLAVRQELEELLAAQDRLMRTQMKTPTVRVSGLWVELKSRVDKLDLLIGKYSFKPQLFYSVYTGLWCLDMVPKYPRGPQVEVRGQGVAFLPLRVQVSEPVVITALARLAASRELAKVHLCTTCKERWHVAVRRIDQFCSTECREQFHTHSDEYRERKKKSQREYRARLKGNPNG